ncbi:hypothetical protein [Wandonia haliotis]
MVLKSNILISFSAAMLALGIGSLYAYPKAITYSVFLFFATLFIYNTLRFVKYYLHPESAQALLYKQSKFVHAFFALTGLTGSVLVFFTGGFFSSSFLFWIILSGGIVSLLYVIPFIPYHNGKAALRDLPYSKLFLIGIVWSALTFFVPAAHHPDRITLFLIGCFYILSVTIPFDIRDLPYDNPEQKTLPQILGWRFSKILSILLCGLFFAILANHFPRFYLSVFFWITVAIHLLILELVHPQQPHNFYGYFVDGLIALLGIFLWYSAY